MLLCCCRVEIGTVGSTLGSVCSISSFVNGITTGACSCCSCRTALGDTLGSSALLGDLHTLGGETMVVILSGVDVGSGMLSDLFSI